MQPNLMLVTLVSAALLVVACSGFSVNRATPQDHSDEVPTVTRTGLSSNVLYVDTVDCGVFDPAIDLWDTGNGIGSPPIVPEIHGGLAKFTDDPTQPVQLELATSYTVSDDGLVYNFTLKPNLKFSDGSPVNSSDFRFSWARALHLGRPGGFAHRYLGAIVGAEDVISGKSTELAGVEVVDDLNFSVALNRPDFNFLMRVAHPVSFVVARDNIEQWDGIWTNDIDPYSFNAPDVRLSPDQLPVGVGPFKLVEFSSSADGNLCVLGRNGEYLGQPPQLEYIVMSGKVAALDGPGGALSTFDTLFENTEIDIDHFALVRLSNEQLDALSNHRPLGPGAPNGLIRTRTDIELAILALNPSTPHLKDPETRRTVLNIADIVSEIYGGEFPLPGRIVPEVLQSGVASVEPVNTDVADTRILSELAATDQVFSIVDTTNSNRFNYQGYVANMTERWWRDFGLDFRVASANPFELTTMLDLGEVDARLWQITLQMPDPLDVLVLFDRPFGDPELEGESSEMDQLFNTVTTSSDAAERRAGLAAIEQHILDSALGAVLHWDVGWLPVRVQPYVHGFTGVTFPRSMFHSVWMDDTAPERPIP